MRRNPAPAPFLQQALALAKFEPGMYEVVESYSPPWPTTDPSETRQQ